MTFNELMYGIAFVAPVFGALSEGRKAGLLGVLVALVVGVALGICSFLVTRRLFRYVGRHPELRKSNPEGVWMLLVWALCVAMFVGIGGIGALGIVATRFVTSHVVG
jgi:MFS family permease